MLDAGGGDHPLGGGGAQQQQQQQQQHQQSPHHHYSHSFGESSSPRFLVPNASTDGSRPNRTRHKLSRSQVRHFLWDPKEFLKRTCFFKCSGDLVVIDLSLTASLEYLFFFFKIPNYFVEKVRLNRSKLQTFFSTLSECVFFRKKKSSDQHA